MVTLSANCGKFLPKRVSHISVLEIEWMRHVPLAAASFGIVLQRLSPLPAVCRFPRLRSVVMGALNPLPRFSMNPPRGCDARVSCAGKETILQISSIGPPIGLLGRLCACH